MGLGSGTQIKPIPNPGYRGQKGTGSRIRNTAYSIAHLRFTFCLDVWLYWRQRLSAPKFGSTKYGGFRCALLLYLYHFHKIKKYLGAKVNRKYVYRITL